MRRTGLRFAWALAGGLLLCPAVWAADTGPTTAPAVKLPRSGQILTYDQTGALIPYEGSGQDGEFQRGAVWPDPRFIGNDDGTVTDALTGLSWFKDGNCFGDLSWPAAMQAVADFNQGTVSCHEQTSQYHDWALPDINQLASLLDAQAGALSDYLKLVGITGVQNGTYWSSSPARSLLNAWAVDFANGAIPLRNKMERSFLLLVRQGPVVAKGATAPTKALSKTEAKPATAGEGGKEPPPSGKRFADNGDGTVTDNLTGLMWLQDASCLPLLDWQGALAAAKGINDGQTIGDCPLPKRRYSDWSVPNVVELRSLVDYGADYPALSQDHLFQRVTSSGYWTATSVAARPEQAYLVDFNTGAVAVETKSGPHRLIPVRLGSPGPAQPRKESEKGTNLSVDEHYVLVIDPEKNGEIHWPPAPRFLNNGDGTSTDALTGVTWLTDANCFGKQSWKEAGEVMRKFNGKSPSPSRAAVEYKCAGYDAGFDDWEVPTLGQLKELVNAGEKDSAVWLNSQGLTNVQGSGIYWSATPTPLNLYFADGISLKSGHTGIYPKSLKFFVWPKRKGEEGKKPSDPLLNLTANGVDNYFTVTQNDPLSFVVYLHSFGRRSAADFWFWYDTPDEKRLWLTPIRTWTEKPTPVYQGPLFTLQSYEIYHSGPNGLAPGVYDFHFAVDTVPNGVFDEPRYEVKMSVVIPGG